MFVLLSSCSLRILSATDWPEWEVKLGSGLYWAFELVGAVVFFTALCVSVLFGGLLTVLRGLIVLVDGAGSASCSAEVRPTPVPCASATS